MARGPTRKWRRRFILCLFGPLILSVGIFSAAESGKVELAGGVTGFWRNGSSRGDAPAGTWKAQWIWMGEDVQNEMMLARRSFGLKQRPIRARLRITATSQYELSVNDQYVTRGPARSAPHHQSYDDFDISALLRRGENVMAVRVHFQERQVSYHDAGRPGLLAQLDLAAENGTDSVITDSAWKVHPDLAWDDDAPRMSRFHPEVCDRVDLRRQIRGWQGIAFDDDSWPPARPLMREVGWPAPQSNTNPQALTPPWTELVQRDLPYLQERKVQAAALIEAFSTTEPAIDSVPLTGQIDDRIAAGLTGYQQGKPLRLPALERPGNWFLLFDLGRIRNGRPFLDIEGAGGTVVRTYSAPYVADNRFTAEIVDSRFIDEVVLSGRRDRWEAVYLKPVRYLGVAIKGGDGPVNLYFAGVSEITYPFERAGKLRTPENDWFERCWEASARTIRACTTDAYTDNYRERRQYAQTGYYAALGNYWTFGDTALQLRYLRQIAEEQEANGMMPAYAPRNDEDFMVILDSNCLWVRGVRNYLLYAGDAESTRRLLPAARKLLDLLHGYTNGAGLIENPPYPYWLDHARIDRRGANFTLNAHYLGALEDFAQVLEWLGEAGAGVFRRRAARVRESLRRDFWNDDRQLFCDAVVEGEQSEMYSEQANGMALAMEVAGEEQAQVIASRLLAQDDHNFITRKSGMTMVTPAMSYFLHLGLCRYGYVKESLNMLQSRFERMLEPGTNQTLWEEWWLGGTGRSGVFTGGRTRSDAQTESAFAPALFGEYLLGIRPAEPGLEQVLIVRPDSGLNQVDGILPSPSGGLAVRWNLATGDGDRLVFEVPPGMQVKLDPKSLRLTDGEILIDGRMQTLDPGRQFLMFEEGKHQVAF